MSEEVQARSQRLPAGVAWLSAAILLFTALAVSLGSGSAPSPPHQPVDFFHRVHAGDRQIACSFCHRTAETAAFAGMPSTELCMRCHRVVIPESPEIWKLRSYWELGQAIPWARVNQLPANVYFSHEAHTAAAGMTCAPCHGQVAQMDNIFQTAPLTMGWCVDCHQKRKASTDCWSCHR
jgi:hypothetical protein